MEENKIKQEKIRKVFLENLPRKSGKFNKINWKESKYYSFNFQWDETIGSIKIIDINRDKKDTKLLLEYKDNQMWISSSHIPECKISMLIGIKTYDYTYNVDELIKTNTGKIKILEQIRIPVNSKSRNNRTEKGYRYRCLIDGNIDTIMETHLKLGKGCNVCGNNKIVKEINSIWATDNYLVKHFVNEEDSYNNARYSETNVYVKCPDCGSMRKVTVISLYMSGFSCPKCGDGISMPNKIGYNILEQLLGLSHFEREYSPDWIGRRFYDFYFKLNNKEYILEMDGALGHGNGYNPMSGQTAEESQFIDNEKDRLAKEHDIEVIRIDCNPSEFGHIKQNIIKNKILNMLFDLSIINWDIVSEYTLTNKMKEACDLWNSGNYDVKEISSMFKIRNTTIRRYLNNGTELNICNYNGLECQISSVSKQVKCIEYNLIFNSITECAKKLSEMLTLKFNIGSISEVCKGNRKTHHGLHFEFA